MGIFPELLADEGGRYVVEGEGDRLDFGIGVWGGGDRRIE